MIPGTGSWIRKWAEVRPNRTVWVSEGRRYSYAEANQRVNQVASVLIDSGVTAGDRVAVLLYNGNELLEIFFACAKIGAIFVPINFRLASPEAVFVLEDCGAHVLFYDAELRTTVEAMQAGIVLGAAGQVEALVRRAREEIGAPGAPVVATGALAGLMAEVAPCIGRVEPWLTLLGLAHVAREGLAGGGGA